VPPTPPARPTPAIGQPSKTRRGLLGVVAAAQQAEQVADGLDASLKDLEVCKEINSFETVSKKVLAQGLSNKYYQGSTRFNLRTFWAEHKAVLPIH